MITTPSAAVRVSVLYFLVGGYAFGFLPQGAATRSISGSVILRGSSIANVRVTLQSASRSIHRILYADGSGTFVFGGVPVGQYEIILEAQGYISLRDVLDVPPGTGPFAVQYVLHPAPGGANRGSKESIVSVPALQIPPEARSELEAGMREMLQKNGAAARKHFEKALQKHSSFPQALHALALLDASENQSERAVTQLRKALEIDPSYAEGYVTLGRVLNLQGKHSEALEAARKGISLRRDIWQGHYEMGVAALSLGQDELAMEAVGKIETLAGNGLPEIHLLRSGVLLKKLRYGDAKIELEAFLSIAPNHPFAELARVTLKEINARLSQPRP